MNHNHCFTFILLTFFHSCSSQNENLNQCYDITWVSRVLNETEPCMDPDNYPCHENQLIISDLPPTDEELAVYSANPLYRCDKRVGEACVKYTYWTRTDEPSEFNITRLCAKGIESPHGVEVDSGCYEEELQGYTLEACFCQDLMCNNANNIKMVTAFLFILLTFSLSA